MVTASPAPRRFACYLLLALLIPIVALAVALALRPAPAAAATPIYACAAKTNGQLRFVSTPKCKSTETLVNLNDPAHPVILCALTGTGQLRKVSRPRDCKGNETTLTVPGENQTKTCVRKDNGALRLELTPCDPVAEVELIIPPRNQAPVAAAKSGTVLEDGSIAISLSATDADGDALQFQIATPPTGGTLGPITGLSCTNAVPQSCTANVTYTPAANFFGADQFTYVANDSKVNSAPATVSLTVTGVNDAPSFSSGGNVTVNEDSGAYSAAWATAVAAGPTNESGQTLTFTVSNDNNALFAAQPAIAANGTLSFTPKANASGTATVSVSLQDSGGTANGGVDTTGTVTFTITVNAVNDAPSFTPGGNVTVLEDSGVYSAAWASGMSAGPADESGQVLHFTVSTNQDAFFAVQPAIDASGTLTFTPAANAFGVANITTRLIDDGGTANGGDDRTDAVPFTITITAVNDEPSFTLPASPNQAVLQDSGAQTVTGFATNISAGPANESGQVLTFTLTNTNNGLFSAQPAINATTGNLTYTPAAGQSGSATVTVALSDDGGTANGGDDTSPSQTFTITVTPPNQAPVADGQSVTTTEGVNKVITLTGSDPDGDAITFSIATNPTKGTLGSIGSVTCDALTPKHCQADVTYDPDQDTNGADSFTFTVNDGQVDSAAATVSISITAVNDAPVLANIEAGALAFAEGDAATAITSAITVSDVDNTDLTGATIAITAGYQNGQDVLAFTNTASITGSFQASSGLLTLSGTASLADYQAALRSVTYVNNSDDPSTATRTVTFQVNDGSAANNLSVIATRDISVSAANDAPVNTVPATQTVDEDTELVFSAANSNQISVADVDAGTSAIMVSLDVDHGTLTLSGTSGLAFVDSTANGTASVHVTGTIANINTALAGLKYRGDANYNSLQGAESLTIVTNDQGNTGSGGAESDTDSVTITVNPVNDAPVLTGTKNYTAHTNLQIVVPDGASDLLAGWSDPDAADGGTPPVLSIESGSISATTPAGGAITDVDNATGAFKFDPPAGATGNVTFTYRVCDDSNPTPLCSANTTVTVAVSGPVIWFVDDSAAAGGVGTLARPFNTLADAGTNIGATTGQRIFLFEGTYTTGRTLNASEWLIGQGATNAPTNTFDALMGITPPAGTIARPTIGSGTATVQSTVTLNTNVTIKGIAIASTTATGLTDSAGATTGVSVDQTSVTTTTGTAVVFNDLSGALTLSNVSKDGAGGAISLTNVGAGIAISAGAIQNTTTTAIAISGGTGAFVYSGTINADTGTLVSVASTTGGTKSFSGAITDGNDGDGSGISLTSNTGATINFTGGVVLSTGGNPAFTATGGGTVVVTGSANTLATTTGTALNVANTTIGASGLTFRRIDANGAANGIVLNNTGANGGLTVTGTGSSGTGGTIQNTTSHGILLATTRNASFNNMIIQNTAGSGVRGTTAVTNFTFTNGTIDNSGTGGGNQDSSIAFNDPTGSATDAKVTGTVTITGNTLTNARWHGVSILQFAGALTDVNISNNVITSGTTTGTGGSSLGSGIQLFAGGVAATVASVTRAELNNNTITNFPGGVLIAVQCGTSNGSGPTGSCGTPSSSTDDIEIQGNFLNGGGTTPDGAGGVVKPNQLVLVTVNGRGVGNFNIQNNGSAADPLSGSAGNIIDISAGGNVTVKATVINNRIDAAGQTVSGTSGIAAGVGSFDVTDLGTLGASTLYATVQNNVVSNSAGSGIRLNVNNGTPTLNAIVTGNSVGAPLSATYGIQVVEGPTGGPKVTNLQISGNTSAGGTGGGNTFPGIGLRKQGTAAGEFNIVGLSPSPATNAQMESSVAGQNTSAAGTFGTNGVAAVNGSSSNWTAIAAVPQP